MTPSESGVHEFIAGWIKEQAAPGSAPDLSPENNLIADGVIDSLGFLNLVGALESEFSVELDFGDLDPEAFTTIAGLTAVVLGSHAKGT
ncbi:MAG TPA: acyl carrier protein [Polyangia bacterium]|jgi:acyl carrier protein|nr:acyl carrier protein [Polyangia bacterium]